MIRTIVGSLTLAGLAFVPAFSQDGTVEMTLPPQTAEVGTSVDVPLQISLDGSTPFVFFAIMGVPVQQIELTGWSRGESLEAFIADHGEPFCDFQLFPDSLEVFIFFEGEFSSDEYGPDIGVLHFAVTAEEPATATFFGNAGTLSGEATAEGVVEIIEPAEFIRGDADNDGIVNALADGLFLLQFGFAGGSAPDCSDAADVDDEGTLNPLNDALCILTFAFLSGQPPEAPYPACGGDPTEDALSCSGSSCP